MYLIEIHKRYNEEDDLMKFMYAEFPDRLSFCTKAKKTPATYPKFYYWFGANEIWF